MKKQKQFIFTDEDIFNDDARKEYQEYRREVMEDPEYTVDDEEWSSHIYDSLDDERENLDVELEGCIVAFVHLGRWNGVCQGAKYIGHNIKDILSSECDYCEWYGDGYNIRGKMSHHDGTNHVLYRVVENRDKAERMLDDIAYGQITEEQFRKRTRSLYPYVAEVYGWKTGRFNKSKATK